jgi:hypothetical protein
LTASSHTVAGKNYTIPSGLKINDIWEWIDEHGQASYGSYAATPGTGCPVAKWAPYALRMCTENNEAVNTPNASYLNSVLNGAFGWLLYYNLPSQTYSGTTTSHATVLNNLNTVSNAIYGKNVIYDGPDYPQDWAKR